MALDKDNLTDAQQDMLDDLVDEFMSSARAAINNAGPSAQIDYLLSQGMTLDDITVTLEGAS